MSLLPKEAKLRAKAIRELGRAMYYIERAMIAAMHNRPAMADQLWRRADDIHLHAAWSALEKWQGRKG